MPSYTSKQKPSKTRLNGRSKRVLLQQLLKELACKVETAEGSAEAALTKGEALVKSMIEQALSGDQRMMGTVFSMVEKADSSEADDEADDPEKRSRHDWECLFAFYGKYEVLIRQEIERLRTIDPDYWRFDWFEARLEQAPWYEDLYSKS